MYNFQIEKCRQHFKENYFDLLKDSGIYFWIAGGCVADYIFNRDYRDVDLFFRSKEDSQKAINFCVENYGFDGIKKYNMLEAFLSHRMDTWEFWHYPNFDDLSPEVCIKYFDFTVNSRSDVQSRTVSSQYFLQIFQISLFTIDSFAVGFLFRI